MRSLSASKRSWASGRSQPQVNRASPLTTAPTPSTGSSSTIGRTPPAYMALSSDCRIQRASVISSANTSPKARATPRKYGIRYSHKSSMSCTGVPIRAKAPAHEVKKSLVSSPTKIRNPTRYRLRASRRK
ncbi:hypothetical protein Mterra_03960 [Calidithermus terrae]|uniref:Uncharacterized protein n=1 Tax=Calidithermus terrae TaxID=1408545 RepID=A0A399DUD7_9DEIN|nr:hypothetical protein Mterra_03960 [Calidithermus terrae]